MTATPTIHLAAVRLMRPIFRDVDIIPWSIARDDPDSRRNALYVINGAWGMLAFAFLVAMLVVGDTVQFLAGDRAGNAVWSIMMGAGFFCLAGCAHVLRRWYWYLPKARRRLRAGDRRGYEDYMQRALPRNSSVVFQSIVGILTAVIAFASL
jgi:hypothetical protein